MFDSECNECSIEHRRQTSEGMMNRKFIEYYFFDVAQVLIIYIYVI